MMTSLEGSNIEFGEILLRSHPSDQAAALLEKSFDSSRAFGAVNTEGSVMAQIAHLAALGGDTDRAREFIELASARSDEDDMEVHIRLHGARAILLAEEEKAEAARAEIARGAAMAEAVDLLTLRGDFERCAARAYALLGDEVARSDALDRALDLYRRKGDVINVGRVEVELATPP